MGTNSTSEQAPVPALAAQKATSSPLVKQAAPARPKLCGGAGTKRAVKLTVVCCVLLLPALLHLARQSVTSPGYLFHDLGSTGQGGQYASLPSSQLSHDKLLGGLLPDGLDEHSCLSRYQFAMYHKTQGRRPSTYLVEKLREQEALQRRCGPGTDAYRSATELLRSRNGRANASASCGYLVSISYRGVGNRMIVLASAFLYAMLTGRVLLVDTSGGVDAMFCEPFPAASWLLPPDFPLTHFWEFDTGTPQSYGNLLQSGAISTGQSGNGSGPGYIYLHMDSSYGFWDKHFFCGDDQRYLRRVPWLVLRADSYFAPGLFLIPTYQDELRRMFPEKDAVFHHLGRYLFHPTNAIWSSVTMYYHAHLARAGKRLGIQIRENKKDGPFRHVLDQVLSCVLTEKLLEVASSTQEERTSSSVSMLVTSLSSWYYEKIRDLYRDHQAVRGNNVSVHQPSSEGEQQSWSVDHNMKAVGEIYLLSMTDVLDTSGFSTFGYVAQSLGGMRPWIMPKPSPFQRTEHGGAADDTVPSPPCRRAMSIEPCFHAPSNYDCGARKDVDVGLLVPYIRHCEDVSWGVKLVNQTE